MVERIGPRSPYEIEREPPKEAPYSQPADQPGDPPLSSVMNDIDDGLEEVSGIESLPRMEPMGPGDREAARWNTEADAIEVVIVVEGFPDSFRSVAVQGVGGDDDYAAVQQLLNELPRTIEYYNRSHPDTPLADETPVYLCGGLALDPEVAMGVADVTGREVANIEPPVDCPPDFPLVQYMTHVGLMLAG